MTEQEVTEIIVNLLQEINPTTTESSIGLQVEKIVTGLIGTAFIVAVPQTEHANATDDLREVIDQSPRLIALSRVYHQDNPTGIYDTAYIITASPIIIH